jgi:hypothetical protein
MCLLTETGEVIERNRRKGPSEWSAYWAAGPAVSIFHSVGDRRLQGTVVSWGRAGDDHSWLGAVRGPSFISRRRRTTGARIPARDRSGGGATPLLLRWNQARSRRWSLFAEVAGGVLSTNRPVPEDTLRLNFTAHAGVGVRLRVSIRHAILAGYRFHHISNGNRRPTNPGDQLEPNIRRLLGYQMNSRHRCMPPLF